MLIYDSFHKIQPTHTDIDFIARSPEAKQYVMVVVGPGTKRLGASSHPDGWDEVEIPEMTLCEIKKGLAKVNGVNPNEIELVPR